MNDLEVHVITMARHGERYAAFIRNNTHLECQVFDAIDGRDLLVEACVSDGLITAECAASGLVTPGLLGSAMSHRSLWRRAAERGTGMLILEDDAITHPGICDFIRSQEILWRIDACLFGLNTDSVMCATSPQGVGHTTSFAQKHPSEAFIARALAATDPRKVEIWRYWRGFGIPCVFIPPHGGQRLAEALLPLRLDGVMVPHVSKMMPGISVDRVLNAVSHRLRVAVVQPFLAYSPNTDSATRQDP